MLKFLSVFIVSFSDPVGFDHSDVASFLHCLIMHPGVLRQVKRQICVTKIRQLAQDACLSTQHFVAMDAVIQTT